MSRAATARTLSRDALRCRRKFLRFFPGGFEDETYFDWERGYKWRAHQQWADVLNHVEFRSLLKRGEFAEIAEGLYALLHGRGPQQQRFEHWIEALASLPRRQTRVLTWPLATVFGFIAAPAAHIFLKPRVTGIAAKEYGFDFRYVSRPNWTSYRSMLDFAETIRGDQQDLGPRDMIDLQGFMWVQGSDEYEE